MTAVKTKKGTLVACKMLAKITYDVAVNRKMKLSRIL